MKIIKNKKSILQKLIFYFVMLALLASIAYADVRPNVVVSGFGIKEGAANAGKKFTLSVSLANTEPSSCAKSITTSIEAGFPFIMQGVSTLSAGDLCSSATKTIEFPMKVDPTASGGFYQIKIANNYESSGYVQFAGSNTINLFVSGSPEINANIISSKPIDIYPGDLATLTVKVENNGNFQAQSLSAVMKSPKPIEINWSKSFNSIELLEPRQSKLLEFAVEVPKDAEAKSYPLSMELSYYDENNARQSETFNLNLYVKKKAQFETSDAGSDTFYSNQNLRKIKILLRNAGTDAARKVRARIIPQFPFSADGSVRYAEIIEAGKGEPMDFNLDVDKDANPGKYALDVLVDFEDAQGKKFQDTAQLALEVSPKGIIRAVFLDYWFLWAIALAIAVFAGRRNYKKR